MEINYAVNICFLTSSMFATYSISELKALNCHQN
uniref:Uncharacterized protein n=1 Tax=Anguilla anguilla TaxID=7936 RepID=A0A0E9W175_ANGAN